jgi:nucleotide-binding universal stress UspA family protein
MEGTTLMALKDILVHIDNSDSAEARLNAALDLVRQHQAHLTGLYVIPPIERSAYPEMHLWAEVTEALEEEAQASAQRAAERFHAALDRAGAAGEWRCVRGWADERLAQASRYADVLIVGQAEESGSLSPDLAVSNHVVLGAACPVLFIPSIGMQPPLGRRVLVAWNGSREAALAARSALPLLTRAEHVVVLAVNPPPGEGAIATADICLYLARHGVNVEGKETVAADLEVGDLLLSWAADRALDLIVMGAYGHTRLREIILGGVTRHLLKHMTVPLWMAH